MKGLRERCEEVLLTCPAGTPDAIKLATEYRLEKRKEQCIKEISSPDNLYTARGLLLDFKDDAAVVKAILPALYKAVWLDTSELQREAPERLSLEAVWPIVVRALEIVDGWRNYEEMHVDGLLFSEA